MNNVLLAPAAILLCGVSPFSLAAEPLSIAPLVVTATRTAQTAEQSLAAVTVIDRAEIERKQAASLPELLRSVPGVSLANNGGPGKSTSLFLRGTESDHLLVLIDGIKVGSATSGSAAFQDLPVELIERIEIVRGPRSSLYGSEAIGGVIQIFTRKGTGAGLKPFFSIATAAAPGSPAALVRAGSTSASPPATPMASTSSNAAPAAMRTTAMATATCPSRCAPGTTSPMVWSWTAASCRPTRTTISTAPLARTPIATASRRSPACAPASSRWSPGR